MFKFLITFKRIVLVVTILSMSVFLFSCMIGLPMFPGAPPQKYKTAEFHETRKLSGVASANGDYNPLANIIYDDPEKFGETKNVRDMWGYETPWFTFNFNYRVLNQLRTGVSFFTLLPLLNFGGSIDLNLRIFNGKQWNISIAPDIGSTTASGFLNYGLIIESGKEEYNSSGWGLNLPVVFSYRVSRLILLNFGPELSYGEMKVSSSFYYKSEEFLGNPPGENYFSGKKFVNYLNPCLFFSIGIGDKESAQFFILSTVMFIHDLHEDKTKVILLPSSGLSF